MNKINLPESIYLEDFNFDLKDIADRPMIAVYEHPTDFPDKYVARVWDCNKEARPTRFCILGEHLKEIRDKIPAGMVRIPRMPQDNLCVVESWI